MKTTFLDFEQSIAELEAKIEELRFVQDESSVDISDEIKTLSEKSQQLIKDIYAALTPWQVSQVARHPQRPYTLDYVSGLFTDFHELHGDRTFADDQSIIGGLARFNGEACMVIGHQKGRDTKERALRNFGMSRPEGYRKAMRLMRLAEKFQIPVFTFVDTPGAFPGIDAEERNQSEAIGHNLYTQAELTVPIIATIIGEGGSGGALAIAMGDVVLMLQNSTYSVISPEGCASILWKTAAKAPEAAEQLALTAQRLKGLGLIDKIVPEPVGGAHRDYASMMDNMRKALTESLKVFQSMDEDTLLERRHERLMSYGKFKETNPRPKPAVGLAQSTRDALRLEVDNRTSTPPRLAIALSGGLDSVVLLDSICRLHQAHTTKSDSPKIVAFHIHHGLQKAADEWLLFCEALAKKYKIGFDFRLLHIDTKLNSGNIEARARAARYEALTDLCGYHGIEDLLLAHHQNDQAETVLLQLMRGAGVAGLSGMPESRLLASSKERASNITLWRPLLGLRREELEAYAREHKLKWIEDPSNRSSKYRRNAVRKSILPKLESLQPGATANLARSADLLAQAQQLLDRLAQQDGKKKFSSQRIMSSACSHYLT
jgi:acetyl-CoA carboxylase carboxyl transferase subunit alpha